MDAQTPTTGVHSDLFWDLYSRVYGGVYHLIPYRGLLWDAYEALDLQPGMRVLDAGCGTGNFEHFVGSKHPAPITVDALEGSRGMLRAARRRCRDLDFVRFSAADLNERLPYETATFDRVVSVNVLYALDDQDQAVREMLRVLKPEGRLVISDPLPTYRVGPMVADHFRRIRNIWGLGRRLARIAETIWTLATSGLVQGLLSTLVIDARETRGRYRSLDEPGFEALLRRRTADGLDYFTIGLAFADQNVFATVWKVAA